MTTETTQLQAYIPGLRRLYAPLAPYAYPFIRFVVGAIIARHGYPKIFEGGAAGLSGFLSGKLGLDPGLAWAWLVACVEFGGGIMLAMGCDAAGFRCARH